MTSNPSIQPPQPQTAAGAAATPAQPPAYRRFLQGSVTAMAGGAASHPLDLLKVFRKQYQPEFIPPNREARHPCSAAFEEEEPRDSKCKRLSPKQIAQTKFNDFEYMRQSTEGGKFPTRESSYEVPEDLLEQAAASFVSAKKRDDEGE